MKRWPFSFAFGAALAACGIDAVGTRLEAEGVTPDGEDARTNGDGSGPDDPTADGGADVGVDGSVDGAADAGMDVVVSIPLVQYMHSPSTLYTVNDVTGQTSSVAVFGGGCSGIDVGDLAIDRAGNAWVITAPSGGGSSSLYTLTLGTAVCGAAVGGLGRRCNALAFAPDPADGAKDVLFAACSSAFYRVDTTTGATTLVGALGTGLNSSGDIVWVPGRGMFITINDAASTDKLGSIDVATGAATVIGTGVGRAGVYGLGHRAGGIIGYGNDYVIKIDPTTGAGSTWNASTGVNAYGAASSP
jgi:hypothetical protein